MPGLIAFGRRWSVGSDDFVVPGCFLFVLHFIWFIVGIGLLFGTIWDTGQPCTKLLWIYYIVFLALIGVCMLVEIAICIAALRGGILNTEKRSAVQHLIYIRLVLMLGEIAWMVLAIKWLVEHYFECPAIGTKEALMGMVISNGVVHLSAPMAAWCVWDSAGRSWVKMKRYQQRSVSSRPAHQHRRRSGSRARNWRQRKVMRAYQDSWDQRCRFLLCCMRSSDRNKNSFADIARLLNDFFRDLDVVPSDVIAGLVLLRKFQKIEQDAIIKGNKNDIHAFLSGVKVTSKTQFLALNNPPELEHFQNVIHYMHFALGAYGWPIYLLTHTMGVCHLCTRLRCGCLSCFSAKDDASIVDDNCCQCNYAALRKQFQLSNAEVEITYATYHVDIGQTPFFIAVDYSKNAVVLSIRGTLSIQDILTDLNAEGETLPLTPPIDDWLGHKGMVEAAEYIRAKILEERLLEAAFARNPSRGTADFRLVVVGHSLGGGTAAILAILLRPQYPSLQCFSYSPPGGLLSMPAVQYSKAFTTSVVVGKDVVPRIGLHQMESLRADLINAIKRSIDPKWKTIACSAVCCGCAPLPRSATALSTGGETKLTEYQKVMEENSSGSEDMRNEDARTDITSVGDSPDSILQSNGPVASSSGVASCSAVAEKTVQFMDVCDSCSCSDSEEQLSRSVQSLDVFLRSCRNEAKDSARVNAVHPSDSSIALTLHNPLYPPGRIIHVVRHHPSDTEQVLAKHEPVYQAVWAENNDFDEVLISPVMIQDHMPDKVLDALNKVITHYGPRKPQRTSVTAFTGVTSNENLRANDHEYSVRTSRPAHRICLETSFTSLQSPTVEIHHSSSKNSSVTGSCYNSSSTTTRTTAKLQSPMQFNSILSYDFVSLLDDRVASATTSRTLTPHVAYGSYDLPSYCPAIKSHGKTVAFVNGTIKPNKKDLNNKVIDLIHDDWYGLAPLASPESLSEISSIGSRASLKIVEASLDYAELTPKVLRRTPGISGNLANCADDARNVITFQKMSQNFRFLRCPRAASLSESSGDSSFESASSEKDRPIRKKMKAAEPAPSAQTQSTSSELYQSTKSSIQSYESFESPLNTASPLHRKAMLLRERNVLGSSHSSSSSLGNSRLCSVIENPARSPVTKPFRSDSSKLLEDSSTDVEKSSDETDKSKIVSFKKRRKSITQTKNESLPLLSSISNNPALSSPSYVKRKKYSVYPETVTLLSKEESSV